MWPKRKSTHDSINCPTCEAQKFLSKRHEWEDKGWIVHVPPQSNHQWGGAIDVDYRESEIEKFIDDADEDFWNPLPYDSEDLPVKENPAPPNIEEIDKRIKDLNEQIQELEEQKKGMLPICQKCEQHKEIPEGDYLCAECRFG